MGVVGEMWLRGNALGLLVRASHNDVGGIWKESSQ